MTSIETSTAATTAYPATDTSAGSGSTSTTSSTSSTSGASTTSSTSSTATTTSTTSTDTSLAGLQNAMTDMSKFASTTPTDSFGMISKLVDVMISLVTMIGSMIKSLLPGGAKPTSDSGTNSPSTGNGSTGSSPGSGTTPAPGGTAPPPSPGGVNGNTPVRQSYFDVNTNEYGMITVRTLDGYTIRAEGKDQAWTITGPDGKTTRIYGDPHVQESDGTKWDFMKNSTFVFGNNKITVQTTTPNAAGKTLTASITIYSGDERVTIGGIDKNKPAVTAVSHDGRQHDASLADGDYYNRRVGPNGEGWANGMAPDAKEMGTTARAA